MARFGALFAILFGLSACSDDSPSMPTDATMADAGDDAPTMDAGDAGPEDASMADAGDTSVVDAASGDAGDDGGTADAGTDAGMDAGNDAGVPPSPPCDATLIGATCERQYPFTGLVRMTVHGDNVYLVEDDTILRLDRMSGQVDVLSTAYDRSNLGAAVGAGPAISQVDYLVAPGDGTTLYAFDDDAEAIFAIDTTTGDRSVVSDASNGFDGGVPVGAGPALSRVNAVTWDPTGNRLLAADIGRDDLLAIDVTTGDRTVISDNSDAGPPFQVTRSLAVDPSTGTIFAYEQNRESLYTVDRATGERTVISSAAGSTDGEVGTGVALEGTRSVVFDPASGNLFMTNTELNAILAIDPATGDRSIFSDPEPESGDPVGAGSSFYYPFEMALGDGELLVDDSHQEVLTSVDLTTGDRSVFLSSRLGEGYRFGNGPSQLAVNASGDTIYALLDSDRKILSVDVTTMDRTVIVDRFDAGSGVPVDSIDGMALDGTSLYFLDDDANSLVRVDTATLARTVVSDDDDAHNGNAVVGTGPALSRPVAVVIDSANNRAFVADSSERAIFSIDLANGNRAVISDDEDALNGDIQVGTGPAFESIEGLALDSDGERLFVTDGSLNAVVAVDLAEATLGNRTIFSDAEDSTNGDVEVGSGPAFGRIRQAVVEAARNRLLVVNSSPDGSEGVYAVDLDTGNRSIVSGVSEGNGWLLDSPEGIALSGDTLYISERSDNYMMRISLAAGTEGDRHVVASGATVDSY